MGDGYHHAHSELCCDGRRACLAVANITKAGKPGWAALIPIYNAVVLMQIIGRPEWWVLLLFVPFVNIYIAVVSTLELAKSFGKSTGFGVLMLFFPVIMYPMLGFGSSQYLGPVAPQPAPYYLPQQPPQA